MKLGLYVFIAFLFMFSFSFAENQPTPAPAANQPTAVADNTKSILNHGDSTNSPATAAISSSALSVVEQTQKCCDVSSKKIVYRNKSNIAPCAVTQVASLSFCEVDLDACCKKSCHLEKIDVPFCAPPCGCTETVSTSREGRKVVYDYGRYEVVLKARHDGVVEVDYRKRLLNR